MNTINKILCPIDLSGSSMGAIELATQLAKQNDAKISFIYVAPTWIPENVMLGSEYVHGLVEEDKERFDQIRPTDTEVGCEHIFVHGNPGPEIVKATKSVDLIVISTHGRTGLMRLIMGSVAEYVLRNAKCPVILAKGFQSSESDAPVVFKEEPKNFVTNVMHHVAPVRTFDKMNDVLKKLEKANETAAPVVDGSGQCIGILTSTDIEHYHVLLERFLARDESVVDEMFEVDKYGQRRTDNIDFDQVRRHMTKDPVCVRNDQLVADAVELFESNPGIHHLVVVDDEHHGIGIIESESVLQIAETEG